MGCGCENKKIMSEYEHVAMLAKKAAMLDGCVYVVYIRDWRMLRNLLSRINLREVLKMVSWKEIRLLSPGT